MKINQDTPLWRAVRTAIQTFVGLALTVWGTPGVPDAVHSYFIALVPAGTLTAAVIAYVWHAYLASKKV